MANGNHRAAANPLRQTVDTKRARDVAQCAVRPCSFIAVVVLALATPALAADTASSNCFRMKLAKVVDAQGFGQPLTAATLLIPSGWTLQSEVVWGGPNLVKLTLRASSPDGRTAVELSTLYNHAWSNGKDEYLISDSSSFDPNTVSKENWTRLQRVEPGKPPED